MKYIVYILKSSTSNKYYIGQTNNLTRRLTQHNNGLNKSTKYGTPWSLVHSECFDTRSEAFTREQQIKRYKGGEGFKKLVG